MLLALAIELQEVGAQILFVDPIKKGFPYRLHMIYVRLGPILWSSLRRSVQIATIKSVSGTVAIEDIFINYKGHPFP